MNNAITEEAEILIEKRRPTGRTAYSDRTSWLMACLSQLTYIRFIPPPLHKSEAKQSFLNTINRLIDDQRQKKLTTLIEKVDYDHEAEKKLLESQLDTLDIQLVKIFDKSGTQAILVENKEFLALAFRGTEATSMKDISADMDAELTPAEEGGRVNGGFDRAFSVVHTDIQETLDKASYAKKPLLITGHSLGGALATIAARRLTHKGGIAACYTYGAPRVGNIEWVAGIKTPIYRIVNAIDGVTMIPPGSSTVALLSDISSLIPVFGGPIQKTITENFSDYMHAGDMRYLTNCTSDDYQEVRLLPATNLLFRLRIWWKSFRNPKKFVNDHSILVYRKKLAIIAQKRNPSNPA